MLFQISNKYKDGYVEDYISSNPNPDQKYIVGSTVFPFKYKVESFLKPGITKIQGKTYITPNWIPCHPDIKLSDIIWTPIQVKGEGKVKNETEITQYEFLASNGKDKYYVKVTGDKMKCTCPGYFRVFDQSKGCKHIQLIRSGLTKGA